MRHLFVLICCLLAGGCALPVPIQVASWVLDGVSIVTTEKSITDHGLSMVAGQDCALWRAMKDVHVCRDDAPKIIATTEPVDVARVFMEPDLKVK